MLVFVAMQTTKVHSMFLLSLSIIDDGLQLDLAMLPTQTEFFSSARFTMTTPSLTETTHTHTHTTVSGMQSKSNSMAGCLLIMDDNFRLYEWLAYHYHVLPLQRLIVAVDPLSKTSPEPVIELFRQELNMSITTWGDRDYGKWDPLPVDADHTKVRELHRLRQQVFLRTCMKQLQSEGWSWTALWDTDEFLVYNQYNKTRRHKTLENSTSTSPTDLSERGNVFAHLKQSGQENCVPMYRVLVSAKETDSVVVNQESHSLDTRRLDTLRFQYRNKYDNNLNGIGKCLVNVQKVDHTSQVRSVHRPAMGICPSPQWAVCKNNPFFIYHYLGSFEAYSFRDDARKGWERTYEAWESRTAKAAIVKDEYAVSWLPGFVKHVGIERAQRLLMDAG